MIVRLVKMNMKAEDAANFEAYFVSRHSLIASFPGCNRVELLKTKACNSIGIIYFTRSIWMNEGSLEAYRNSGVFKETWTQVKQWFNEKAEAWTTEIVEGND
ncbi:MAG: autoinducer 2-degrading protein [Bacteroidia bacterium]|jgi:autoinducer 2-degrading protein